MKVSGTLSGFKNSIIDMDVYIDNPYSGFKLTAMETGDGTRYDVFSFSGNEGYLFDQSGSFFGGYKSGSYLNIQAHFDFDNSKFKYYFDGDLISNDMGAITSLKPINCIEFEKYNDSRLEVSVTGIAS